MKCSDAQVDTAQISLPVRLGGLGVHLMFACDGTTCDAAFLAAAALTHRAESGGSEHFCPFKGASGVELQCGCMARCNVVVWHGPAVHESDGYVWVGCGVDRYYG